MESAQVGVRVAPLARTSRPTGARNRPDDRNFSSSRPQSEPLGQREPQHLRADTLADIEAMLQAHVNGAPGSTLPADNPIHEGDLVSWVQEAGLVGRGCS